MSADEADGEAPESGGVLGAVAGTDATSVFVEGGVEDVVSGFDTPVSPIESEEALRAGGVGGMAGDAVGVLDAAFTEVGTVEALTPGSAAGEHREGLGPGVVRLGRGSQDEVRLDDVADVAQEGGGALQPIVLDEEGQRLGERRPGA